LFSQFLSDR